MYIRALASEMSRASQEEAVGELCTLYIGGGTPTALSVESWRALADMIEGAFSFAPNAEVTVEANPCSLSAEHLRLWSDWRVTRVSVGVQSFDDAELVLLGRAHDACKASDAVCACLASGFSVSLDLMFGLPGGTLRNWARTLDQALALAVHHISLYQLTIEQGTPYAERGFNLTDGYAPYRYAQWLLPRRGYRQYEVASFARPGHECRHNLGYWDDGGYLGLGPAAWSHVGGTRRKNEPALARYASLVSSDGAVVFSESLTLPARARQAAVLALRTARGIEWGAFAARFGELAAREMREKLAAFPGDLVLLDESRAALTPRGLRVANLIWEDLI